MPGFDADKFLAEHQAEQAPTSGGFDADKFLQANGVQTLPNQGQIQNSPSTAEAIGRAATQGPTAGFGDELSAAAGALFPTATDQALNRSYTDRYASIRDQIRNDNSQAQQAHPVVSALSEIASSLPLAIATGGGNVLATAGLQGAAYGLGKSNKDSVQQAVTDTAKSGLLSLGLAGAFSGASKFIKELPEAGLNSSVDEIGNAISKSAPKVSMNKAGDYLISYGTGIKDAFKVGKEMQVALANPDVQASIVQDLNSQQGKIADVIKSTKDTLGQTWKPLIEQHGNAPADASKAFESVYKNIEGIVDANDPVTSAVKQGLKEHVQGVEKQLLAQSSDGTLKSVPMKALADAQEQLGNVIFQQKAFNKPGSSSVNGAAKRFFGDMARAFNSADETVGSGGDLSNINKVFHALYGMEENKLTGAALKSLTDPQNASAAKKYAEFIAPFAKLSPETRQALAPQIESYLTNDFQKALTKAQVMKLVTSRGAQNIDSTHTILSLAGLRGATKATMANIANRAGALLGSGAEAPPAAMGLGQIPYNRGVQTVAPALGALSVDQSQPSGRGSLNGLNQ